MYAHTYTTHVNNTHTHTHTHTHTSAPTNADLKLDSCINRVHHGSREECSIQLVLLETEEWLDMSGNRDQHVKAFYLWLHGQL